MQPSEVLSEILNDYSNGLYTKGEIESTALRLLGGNEQYWEIFPDWLKPLLIARVKDFNHTDTIITFGHADPKDIKNQMTTIKDWMLSKGII